MQQLTQFIKPALLNNVKLFSMDKKPQQSMELWINNPYFGYTLGSLFPETLGVLPVIEIILNPPLRENQEMVAQMLELAQKRDSKIDLSALDDEGKLKLALKTLRAAMNSQNRVDYNNFYLQFFRHVLQKLTINANIQSILYSDNFLLIIQPLFYPLLLLK